MIHTVVNNHAVSDAGQSESVACPDIDEKVQIEPPISPNPIVSPTKQARKEAISAELFSPATRRRRRAIKFNKVVHNRRIPHLNDLRKEVIEATWIQPEEYVEIRSRCIDTVRRMMRGTLTQEELDGEDHCPRGLEGKTKYGSAIRREHKLDSIAAVMEEQTLQWNEDVDDEEAIMEVYTVFSVPCSEAAHQVGLEDAQVARECLEYPPSVAPATTPAPTTPGATVVVDRLREILFMQSSRSALLRDIDEQFYDEAAMERRRNVYTKPRDSAVALKLREYFVANPNSVKAGISWSKEDQDMPSLASSHGSSSTTDDDSGISEDSSTFNDSFTSQIQEIFHSRKRRQALLDAIEASYHEDKDPSIVTMGAASQPYTVSKISEALGARLKDIFYFKKRRAAVVEELESNSYHLRQ